MRTGNFDANDAHEIKTWYSEQKIYHRYGFFGN